MDNTHLNNMLPTKRVGDEARLLRFDRWNKKRVLGIQKKETEVGPFNPILYQTVQKKPSWRSRAKMDAR